MTGNPTVDKIILALNGIIVLAATGLVVYSHTSIKRPTTNQGAELGSMMNGVVEQAQIPTINFPKMVINLYSRSVRLRHLEVELNVEPFAPEDGQIVTNYAAILKDVLIDVAGDMTPDELNSITGRILLEARMKTKINEYIQKKVVKKIYFSRFIIQ